ncbi:hypothetical protein DIPPA_31740 [Diplonema papillatum]|nr:hypothetical protein DIPPA_31740 [Diplonema papillatum]
MPYPDHEDENEIDLLRAKVAQLEKKCDNYREEIAMLKRQLASSPPVMGMGSRKSSLAGSYQGQSTSPRRRMSVSFDDALAKEPQVNLPQVNLQLPKITMPRIASTESFSPSSVDLSPRYVQSQEYLSACEGEIERLQQEITEQQNDKRMLNSQVESLRRILEGWQAQLSTCQKAVAVEKKHMDKVRHNLAVQKETFKTEERQFQEERSAWEVKRAGWEEMLGRFEEKAKVAKPSLSEVDQLQKEMKRMKLTRMHSDVRHLAQADNDLLQSATDRSPRALHRSKSECNYWQDQYQQMKAKNEEDSALVATFREALRESRQRIEELTEGAKEAADDRMRIEEDLSAARFRLNQANTTTNKLEKKLSRQFSTLKPEPRRPERAPTVTSDTESDAGGPSAQAELDALLRKQLIQDLSESQRVVKVQIDELKELRRVKPKPIGLSQTFTPGPPTGEASGVCQTLPFARTSTQPLSFAHKDECFMSEASEDVELISGSLKDMGSFRAISEPDGTSKLEAILQSKVDELQRQLNAQRVAENTLIDSIASRDLEATALREQLQSVAGGNAQDLEATTSALRVLQGDLSAKDAEIERLRKRLSEKSALYATTQAAVHAFFTWACGEIVRCEESQRSLLLEQSVAMLECGAARVNAHNPLLLFRFPGSPARPPTERHLAKLPPKAGSGYSSQESLLFPADVCASTPDASRPLQPSDARSSYPSDFLRMSPSMPWAPAPPAMLLEYEVSSRMLVETEHLFAVQKERHALTFAHNAELQTAAARLGREKDALEADLAALEEKLANDASADASSNASADAAVQVAIQARIAEVSEDQKPGDDDIDLRLAIVALKRENSELQDRVIALAAQVTPAGDRALSSSHLHDKIGALEKENRFLSVKVADMNETVRTYATLTTEISALRLCSSQGPFLGPQKGRSSSLAEIVRSEIEAKLKSKDDELQGSLAEQAALRERVASLEKKLEDKEVQLVTAQKTHRRTSLARNPSDGVHQAVAELREKVVTLERALTEQTSPRRDATSDDFSDLRHRVDTLEKELHAPESPAPGAGGDLQHQLDAKSRALSLSSDEIARLQARIADLEGEAKQHQQQQQEQGDQQPLPSPTGKVALAEELKATQAALRVARSEAVEKEREAARLRAAVEQLREAAARAGGMPPPFGAEPQQQQQQHADAATELTADADELRTCDGGKSHADDKRSQHATEADEVRTIDRRSLAATDADEYPNEAAGTNELRGRVRVLETQLEQRESEVADLQSAAESRLDTVRALERQLAEHTRRLSARTTDSASSADDVAHLKDRLAAFERGLLPAPGTLRSDTAVRLNQDDRKADLLEQKLATTETLLGDANARVAELKDKVNDLEKQVLAKEKELLTHQVARLSDGKKLDESHQSAEDMVEGLQDKIRALERELANEHTESTHLQKEVDALEQDVAEYKEEIDVLQDEVDSLQEEVTRLTEERDAARSASQRATPTLPPSALHMTAPQNEEDRGRVDLSLLPTHSNPPESADADDAAARNARERELQEKLGELERIRVEDAERLSALQGELAELRADGKKAEEDSLSNEVKTLREKIAEVEVHRATEKARGQLLEDRLAELCGRAEREKADYEAVALLNKVERDGLAKEVHRLATLLREAHHEVTRQYSLPSLHSPISPGSPGTPDFAKIAADIPFKDLQAKEAALSKQKAQLSRALKSRGAAGTDGAPPSGNPAEPNGLFESTPPDSPAAAHGDVAAKQGKKGGVSEQSRNTDTTTITITGASPPPSPQTAPGRRPASDADPVDESDHGRRSRDPPHNAAELELGLDGSPGAHAQSTSPDAASAPSAAVLHKTLERRLKEEIVLLTKEVAGEKKKRRAAEAKLKELKAQQAPNGTCQPTEGERIVREVELAVLQDSSSNASLGNSNRSKALEALHDEIKLLKWEKQEQAKRLSQDITSLTLEVASLKSECDDWKDRFAGKQGRQSVDYEKALRENADASLLLAKRTKEAADVQVALGVAQKELERLSDKLCKLAAFCDQSPRGEPLSIAPSTPETGGTAYEKATGALHTLAEALARLVSADAQPPLSPATYSGSPGRSPSRQVDSVVIGSAQDSAFKQPSSTAAQHLQHLVGLAFDAVVRHAAGFLPDLKQREPTRATSLDGLLALGVDALTAVGKALAAAEKAAKAADEQARGFRAQLADAVGEKRKDAAAADLLAAAARLRGKAARYELVAPFTRVVCQVAGVQLAADGETDFMDLSEETVSAALRAATDACKEAKERVHGLEAEIERLVDLQVNETASFKQEIQKRDASSEAMRAVHASLSREAVNDSDEKDGEIDSLLHQIARLRRDCAATTGENARAIGLKNQKISALLDSVLQLKTQQPAAEPNGFRSPAKGTELAAARAEAQILRLENLDLLHRLHSTEKSTSPASDGRPDKGYDDIHKRLDELAHEQGRSRAEIDALKQVDGQASDHNPHLRSSSASWGARTASPFGSTRSAVYGKYPMIGTSAITRGGTLRDTSPVFGGSPLRPIPSASPVTDHGPLSSMLPRSSSPLRPSSANAVSTRSPTAVYQIPPPVGSAGVSPHRTRPRRASVDDDLSPRTSRLTSRRANWEVKHHQFEDNVSLLKVKLEGLSSSMQRSAAAAHQLTDRWHSDTGASLESPLPLQATSSRSSPPRRPASTHEMRTSWKW